MPAVAHDTSHESANEPREIDAFVFPASFAQSRLWFLSQLDPASPVYNVPAIVRVDGPLDRQTLERAVNEIIARHESLRTTFRVVDDRPAQVILPDMRVRVNVVSLSALPRDEREGALAQWLVRETSTPFDLAKGPLLRVSLVELGEREHVLVFGFHHIVTDMWSQEIFMRELTTLYRAFQANEPSPLPALRIQYADYSSWQREMLANAATASHLAFWREQFRDLPAPLPIPADRPRPARQSLRGALSARDLSAGLSAGLREVARSEGVTLFVLTLAACKALLARYSGETDICIGSPVAQRPSEETEELIGYFLNTLALRSNLSGDPDFRELLRRVRSTVLDAFQHQDVPFEKIVEEVQPGRDASRHPIFQIAFVLLPAGNTMPSFPGTTVVPVPIPVTTAKFDLTICIEEAPGGMRATIEYATDLFEAATVDQMLESLQLMLEGIVADPSTPLSRLPILGAAQRSRILTEWSGSERPYPAHQTIAARFAECVARTPDAIAMIDDGTRLTYRELDALSNRVARHLQSHGIREGDFVGLRAERSLAFVVKVLGITKAGAAYVPLDGKEPAARLEGMKAACAFILDAEPGAAVFGDPVAPAGQPDGPAYVLFTSGSTGVPKGVIIPHRGITRLVVNNDYAPFQPDDIVAFASNVCFDAATFEIWGALLNGGSLVITPHDVLLSPTALAAHLAAHRVTVLFLTTSLFNRLIHEAPAMFGGLRMLVFGGEAADAASVRLVLAHGKPRRLVNGYGPTETTTFAICHAIEKCEGASIPIGRPIANTRAYLLDGAMQPVPVGVAGEICISGPGVALGYHAAPELTAEKFIGTPYGRLYRTGDLARWLPDGTVEYLGRADQQVKLRGFRIEPGEIEFALKEHAAIREAAVIARPDGAGKIRLVAYLVSDTPPSSDELRAHLKARLPEHMIPPAFVFLPALPLTGNGKLDRRALPEPAPARTTVDFAQAVPRTPVEQALADIWAKVLRLDRVGVHDNFFTLGGDSILSIQIIARARDTGLALSPRQLFEHQTIAELAAVAQPLTPATAGEQGSVSGEAPLTAIQHWFFEQELADMHHWNQAFVFALTEPPDPALLARAAAAVERHHDSLRLRFQRDENGTWHQRFAAEPASGVIDPGPLDLARGPLWRLIQTAPDRLAIAVHHLAIDGVSWRILLEDLETACTQLRAGLPVSLPPKTTSFKEWSERLQAFARSGALDAERDYWRAVTGPELKTDFPGENIESSARTVTVSLTAEETGALLQRVPAAYRTQINDVLLTALAQTFGGTVHLDLEGHGREDVIEGADLSRTIGWFTSIFPVTLDLRGATAPGEALKRTKEQLRSIPRRGLGYGLLRYLADDPELRAQPQPGVVFNYLGQFDQVVSGSRLFRFAPEDGEPFHSPRARRRHLLAINSLILGDRLEFRFEYSANCHRAETVGQLANDYLHALRGIIGHCLSPEAGGCTPSDFPLVRLDQQTVDLLAGGDRNVEEICPLSAMQLLFYSLGSVEGHPADQWQCRLRGPLDAAAFQRAWRGVYQRHPILRTVFRSEGLPEAVQIVFRNIDLPWTLDDWRGLPPDVQAARLAEFLRTDREREFNLSEPPLARFALLRLQDDEHQFVWSLPDLLIDGWSWPIVFRELGMLYDAGADAGLDRARPYRDYIAWLGRQTPSAAEAFWRRHLAGRTAPTTLPSSAGRDEAGFSEARLSLTADETTRLTAFARERQLTPGALVHAAWALVLARQSGSVDILFGSAFSGRPTDLRGAESIVGLFVNNLPLRARFSRNDSVLSLAQALQNEIFSVSQHQFTPLIQIQGWSGIPWRQRLFESLLVFQNYSVDESAQRLGSSVEICEFDGPTHTNYALTLVASPGPALGLTLIHRRGAFDSAGGAALLDDVRTALDSIVQLSAEPISRALERLSPPPAGAPSAPVHPRSFTPPKDETETMLAGVWAEAFGTQIGTDENFFALGGHSLLALRLLGEIRTKLGVDIPARRFFETPTIAGLAAYVSGQSPDTAPADAMLVPIHRGNPSARPLFLVPGGWGGDVEFLVYAGLAQYMDPSLPIHGLRARPSSSDELPDKTVGQFAAGFIEAIRRVQPDGPYMIGGECVGGVLAYEVARQLEAAGQEVSPLLLLNPSWPCEEDLRAFNEGEAEHRQLKIGKMRLTPGQHWAELRKQSPIGMLRYAWHHLWPGALAQKIANFTAERDRLVAWPRRLLDHRPQPYSGRVTFVQDEVASHGPDLARWRQFHPGEIDACVIPGDHISCIRKHAPETAAKLREIIESANHPIPC